MSKKYTVYLPDDAAERLEAETNTKASPGAVIKNRLLEAWYNQETAPVVPKSVPTDSVFTRGGDEIKLHVSDNNVSMLAESNMNKRAEEPVSFTSDVHVKVLSTINGKQGQFFRSEIVKETKAPGNVVDDVIKGLLFDRRIRKVSYNGYENATVEINVLSSTGDDEPGDLD